MKCQIMLLPFVACLQRSLAAFGRKDSPSPATIAEYEVFSRSLKLRQGWRSFLAVDSPSQCVDGKYARRAHGRIGQASQTTRSRESSPRAEGLFQRVISLFMCVFSRRYGRLAQALFELCIAQKQATALCKATRRNPLRSHEPKPLEAPLTSSLSFVYPTCFIYRTPGSPTRPPRTSSTPAKHLWQRTPPPKKLAKSPVLETALLLWRSPCDYRQACLEARVESHLLLFPVTN